MGITEYQPDSKHDNEKNTLIKLANLYIERNRKFVSMS